MNDLLIVKRYAEAFMQFAKETIGLEAAVREFKSLKILMRNNPEFGQILDSLDVTSLEKSQLIDKILTDGFSREIIQFLKLLLEKKRINKIIDIADYVRIAYAHLGETDAILRTSFPLDLELVQEIKARFEKKLNKKLRFYIDLDGELLGGVQVVIGNTVFDGSLKHGLDNLKEKLLTVKV